MREAIYFIAVLPPVELRKEINIFKNYVARAFDSKHGLTVPPSIAVFPPFKWEEHLQEDLEDVIVDVADGFSPFYVHLQNFDCFSPSVIYIKVMENTELKRLHRELVSKLYSELEVENKSPHTYNPHLSVAFRDLKRNYFMKAWSHFAMTKYERVFQSDRLALLKHEDGKWEIVTEFELT